MHEDPKASYNVRKQVRAKISKQTNNDGNISKRYRSQLKKFPVTKDGKI